jgi:hypothetical protein
MQFRTYSTSLLAVVFALFAATTAAQESSPLGVYGKISTYCGSDPIRKDINTIPHFGCFVLSQGIQQKVIFRGTR